MIFRKGFGSMKALNRTWNGFIRMLAIIIFLVIWQVLPSTGLVNPIFLPAFSKVMVALWGMTLSGVMERDLLISLWRAVVGFGLGVVIAVPLGLIIGWFKRAERFFDPLFQLFRQTSALALLPVFMLIFGIGESSKIAIIFWGVQWPILLNTISGVKTVDPLYIKSARSMNSPQITLFTKVILPGALPAILTGVRLSATTAIVLLTAAEMIGANSGLGFEIYFSQETFKIPDMYASIVVIALLGFAVNYLLVLLEKRTTKWMEDVPEIE
jgi:ABC-type nitrate/sulfonate/bicarbonate transport system, permease component